MNEDLSGLTARYQGLLNGETMPRPHVAASILFEMAEEEGNTNKRYALLIELAAQCMEKAGDAEAAEFIRSQGREIMGDEDNHCTKFKYMASECIGVTEPED